MKVAGHRTVVENLVAHLPPVALLLGPEHVGKKTVARHIQITHTSSPLDRLWVSKLTAETASTIIRYTSYAPGVSPYRIVVACIDGASPGALNSLLKLLEEPPPTARFILVASRAPLPTIRSRSQVYPCGLLSDAEVEQALVAHGLDPVLAARQAPLGCGQVRPAIETVPRSRAAVVTVLRAALSGDGQMLAGALRTWDSDCQQALQVWCTEALSGRWRMFSSSDSPAGAAFARRVLASLVTISAARPRLAAHTALEAAIKER